jgi:hypothetical protein
MRESEISRSATATLERYLKDCAYDLPVDLDRLIFDGLCEHDGLVFIDDQDLGFEAGTEVLGRTELIAGKIFVCAKQKASNFRRYRFTVAHEIGHWVLHRAAALTLLRSGAAQTGLSHVFVSTGNSLQSIGGSSQSAERQANKFASHLLLPRKSLRLEFSRRFGGRPLVSTSEHGLREFSSKLARERIGSMATLADLFETSAEATAIAIEESGLVVREPLLL